ncbi:transcriptional regulator, ArsR family [Ferroglobus placidus DSM 10642]|uniref:Transcriptional regulator, ArsR family n=1 Tax=Ferroglobus placidus (strain DSM 10642 / AEDII12DO) TaxID=589924 RepID=D3RXP1_FERPA|nr:ArsR family transcriptional regulator [Ferroglobus placidus]ADC65254.1 transcriptional regulator, ArsR family [Ferroglobus placidus DSM 10642]
MRRAKLINDVIEFIPILQLFSSENYRRVYEILLDGWKTIDELKAEVGENVEEALKILKKAGMLGSKWRMPEDPKSKPEKEYHVSFTHLSANFYCSLKDFNTVLDVIFMSDDEFEDYVDLIIEQIKAGRMSIQHISKETGLDPVFIRAVAKKSLKLNLKGQLVEIAKDEEI